VPESEKNCSTKLLNSGYHWDNDGNFGEYGVCDKLRFWDCHGDGSLTHFN